MAEGQGMKGRISDLNVSIFNDKQKLTFEIDGDFRTQYDELKGKDLDISVKVFRQKRSLDQNSYAWVLIGKIADKLRASKDDVYLTMLKRYGQGGVIKVQPQNEQAILSAIKYYEPHEKLYTDSDKYYRIWAGSSGYNTEEMTIFVDGIISEAKEMGIETMTPDELLEMRSLEGSR
jgi:hypothetical protein